MEDFNPDDEPKTTKGEEEEESDLVGQKVSKNTHRKSFTLISISIYRIKCIQLLMISHRSFSHVVLFY